MIKYSSLIIKIVEALLWLLLTRTNISIVIYVYHAFSLKLVDELLGMLVLLSHLVELGQLLLGSCQLGQLSLHFRLFVCLGLLGGGYLDSGPSSFAGYL